MDKPTVNAKEVLVDIRAGMDNVALGEKYKLSEAGLKSLFKKLVKAGLLKQSEMDERFAPPSASTPAWECPACGTRSPETWDSCPRCGIDVAKYKKQQADLAGPAAAAQRTDAGPGPVGAEARAEGDSSKKPCPFCNMEIDSAAVKCVHCGQWISGSPGEAYADSDWDESYCPWEDLAAIGWFEGIKQTVTGVLFSPTEFFSKMPKQGGYQAPLWYGVILGTFGIIVGQFWNLLLQLGTGNVSSSTFLLIIFAPVLAAIGVGLTSLVNHLCLYLVGGANEDLEATFRVICYSYSTNVWAVIPIAGPLVGLIWQVVALVIGLREAHDTTTGKAVLAVFLPAIVCCSLAILVGFFFGFIGAALG